MYVIEVIRLSLHTLMANKLRAALTMFGISIGVGAVIALLAIGAGVQSYITQQFSSAGTNLVAVVPGQIQRGGGNPFGPQAALSMGDYRAVAGSIPFLVDTAVDFTGVGNFTFESQNSQVSVSGVTPSYESVRNWRVRIGRFIDDMDYGGRSRVVVLGQTVANDLFPGQNPLDAVVKINNVPFRVIGVMETKGASFLGDQDAVAFIPLTTAQERLFQASAQTKGGDRKVSMIYLQVTDDGARPIVVAAVKQLLHERHRIAADDPDDFSVVSQTELINTFGAVTGVLTIFLGAIAAISLLVGGIGIMNIMLVSVTERTREIGLRKAIGATSRAILGQFLAEAMFLSLLGGLVGIGIGVGGAFAVSKVADIQPEVQLSAIALAVGFSLAVGLFFGIYPARRASRLNPIDALRFE
ncbi:MAG: ABC transporter permease [Chloroflexi bacterium]|nr:ABC transporter permease [Chloroflexota bacterium]